MTYQNELKQWIVQGRKDNYNYLLVVYDNQDKDYFPMFFHFYSDVMRYRHNVISETKVTPVEEYKLYAKIGGIDDNV
jgi:hypothetical protein